MTRFISRFGLLTTVTLIGLAQVAGCAPPPATRTVTSEVTTTTVPVPPPVVTTTTTEAVETAPVQHRYVRRARHANGDVVVREETTETGSTTIVPAAPPVQSTVTRTTRETIAPR
jgi:hypothetical protein